MTSEISHVYGNEEFGHWKITVVHPLYDENGSVVKDKKGRVQIDKAKTETEIVPFTYPAELILIWKQRFFLTHLMHGLTKRKHKLATNLLSQNISLSLVQ